ncbi:MAG: UDP-N-acetylmuramate dehydrogenase [Herpetosiphon sp.]
MTLPHILEHEPLARYVAWRIGGPARFFATASNAAELAALVRWGWNRDLPIFVLGGGSNILVSDAGYPGLVIRNRAVHWEVDNGGAAPILRVASGAPMAGTARRLAALGFGGLIWAEGLPGTVGGAVYGNAGCYGGDTAGNLVAAQLLQPDGTIATWTPADLAYGYRTSALKANAANGGRLPVVLGVELQLEHADPAVLAVEMASIATSRKARTPSGSSCGSSFKNPPADSAGRLLEAAGLKGTRVGAAEVSDKHANYIVNLGGATAMDVLHLTDLMRRRVLEHVGVALELEVQLVGADREMEQSHE